MVIMPIRYEIDDAFKNAIKISAKGRRTVTTEDFVAELAERNWHWDLREANHWIEIYVNTFHDVSEVEGEARTFALYNPNGGR
jgi:hypothetical protein